MEVQEPMKTGNYQVTAIDSQASGDKPKLLEIRKLDRWKFVKQFYFFLEESFIIANDLNERTGYSQVLEYLNFAFTEYDVDCGANQSNEWNYRRWIVKVFFKRIRFDASHLRKKDLPLFPQHNS